MIVGIDPGKDGAVAVIDQGGNLIVFDTPTAKTGKKREYDLRAMVELLRPYQSATRAAIERQAAMPGQGVVSMFSTGEGYGIWLGMLAALGMAYEIVMPQRWRKIMLAGYQKAETPEQRKAQSVLHAQRLFPAHAAQFRGPRGGMLDGRADATLIAEYLRRTTRLGG